MSKRQTRIQKLDISRRLYGRKSDKNHKVAATNDTGSDDLLESTVRDPDKLTVASTTTTSAMRARIIQRLQQERGNSYVQRVIAALARAMAVVQLSSGNNPSKRRRPAPVPQQLARRIAQSIQ